MLYIDFLSIKIQYNVNRQIKNDIKEIIEIDNRKNIKYMSGINNVYSTKNIKGICGINCIKSINGIHDAY